MDPFTYQEYRLIIDRMKEQGYRFVGYHETYPLDGPVCVLRHDIDFDAEKAVPLAEIEKTEGIKSTFCIQIRSRSYNPLSKSGSVAISRILENGHWIGLHFDCASYGNHYLLEELKEACSREIDIVERWFGVKLVMVSFHRPSALVLSGVPITDLPSPYGKKFMREMTYRADSAGTWRFGHPLESEAFLNKKPLNLCIHPEWWGEKYQSSVYNVREIMIKRWKEFGEDFVVNVTGMV